MIPANTLASAAIMGLQWLPLGPHGEFSDLSKQETQKLKRSMNVVSITNKNKWGGWNFFMVVVVFFFKA